MLDKNETIRRKKVGIGALTVITILAVALVVAGILFLLRHMGRQSLATPVAGAKTDVDIGEEAEALKENQILFREKVYELNEDIITILVMGIDDETYTEVGGTSWLEEEDNYYNGGQADALFLIVLDEKDKKAEVVSIPRNAMVDVDVWDAEGNYEGVFTKQVCLQHGYGDGGVESCKRQVKTVSRMLHNIPIDSYVAISMDGIPELNDAVGGVEVEVLDDIIYPEYDMNLHQGETVTLQGEKAYWYLRLRNENVFNSSEMRLQRQKQYLTNFMAKAKNRSASDIRVALDLYQIAQNYMVTDIDISSFTYLATELLGYSFDVADLYSIEGEVVQGNKFEEFYMDDEALQELMVHIFYEEVTK